MENDGVPKKLGALPETPLILAPGKTRTSTPNVGEGGAVSCRRKLEYNHIWDQIDNLCNSSTHVRSSFQLVFGELSLSDSFGSKARSGFDCDVDAVISQLERVCRMLKEDDTAQRGLTQILYESSVAAHDETMGSKLSETSFNDSFDNINTSRSNLDISLNESLLIEQRLHPAKRRRISFNSEFAVGASSPDPSSSTTKPAPLVRFTTPQPSMYRSFTTPQPTTHRASEGHLTSIAKIALTENRKNGHRVTSLSDFLMIKPISKGAYGKVYLAKRSKTTDYFAIKIMKKEDLISKNMVDQVVTERDALALAKSPFIVKLFYSFQSKHEVYFVMEYLIGGDLCSFLSYVGCLEESHARLYVVEVALALHYLHQHNIIHKDLKPDNMLIDKRGHIKLTDFGLSSIRLQRKLTISDLVYSPYTRYSPSRYWRTPGQLASLTSRIAFRESPVTPGEVSSREAPSLTTPTTRHKRPFVPKRCSFGGSANKSPVASSRTRDTTRSTGPGGCLNVTKSPISKSSIVSPASADRDVCADKENSYPTRYKDEDVSFGDSPNSSPSRKPSWNTTPDAKRQGSHTCASSLQVPGPTTPGLKQDHTRNQKQDHTPNLKRLTPAPSTREAMSHSLEAMQGGLSAVIGTPDYIAPELLLHRPHTPAADWWSLGVVMYELMVGCAPFHDNTVADIFRNILNSDIEWPGEPDSLTCAAKSAILSLLQFEPGERAARDGLKRHAFFTDVDWDNILLMEMPFVPQPENDTDTGYFDGHNSAFNIKLSDFDGCNLKRDDSG